MYGVPRYPSASSSDFFSTLSSRGDESSLAHHQSRSSPGDLRVAKLSKEIRMAPDPISSANCNYPNYFSSALVPTVEQRLPQTGTLGAIALDHLTSIRPFFNTVSEDLCDDGRMGVESAKSAVSFITRSAASATIVGGTAALASYGLVVGSPWLAVGAGIAGLAFVPPLVERAAFGIADFAGDLLKQVKREE